MPLSASPGEQSACAIQLRLLQDFSNAIATPDKSLWRTSMLAAFGSARTHGLRQELCGPASHLSLPLARFGRTPPTRAASLFDTEVDPTEALDRLDLR